MSNKYSYLVLMREIRIREGGNEKFFEISEKAQKNHTLLTVYIISSSLSRGRAQEIPGS